MAHYRIEVPHKQEEFACAIAAKALLETGSHFLANADFGCEDGVHVGWINVEVDTKEDALAIVPPPFRRYATVIKLNKFTLDEVDGIIRFHPQKQREVALQQIHRHATKTLAV